MVENYVHKFIITDHKKKHLKMKFNVLHVFLSAITLLQQSCNAQIGSVMQDGSSAIKNKSRNENLNADTQGESKTITARNAFQTGLQFDENYKTLLNGESSAKLDLLNDSAEVDDVLNDEIMLKQRFDEFSLPEIDHKLKNPPKTMDNIENVYKVPKSKSKKTESIRSNIAPFKTNPVINDINSDKLIRQENRFSNESFFHAFTDLYDHFAWVDKSLSSASSRCFADITLYLDGLRTSKPWAVKASDASGRYRGMYFFENDYWLGSMQYCYEINQAYRGVKGKPEFQFFVIKMIFGISLGGAKQSRLLSVGQCLPKSCTTTDVTSIMNSDPASITLKELGEGEHDLNIFETRRVPGDFDILKNVKFYVFGLVIAATLALVIAATIYENSLFARGVDLSEIGNKKTANKSNVKHAETTEMNIINNNNEEPCSGAFKAHHREDLPELGFASKFLLCFACGSNARVILSAKTNSEDSLSCIHGLRLFTLLWTILVHTYLQFFAVGENRFNRKISERTFIYQLVGNATFSVDTFFFISGLLVVLLFLKAEKSKKTSESTLRNEESRGVSHRVFWLGKLRKSFFFIFYRFLRLTPTYLIIIVFTELTMKVVYNGSVFTPGLQDHVNCGKYFWRNILYVNNFYPLSEMCMMWSWYLANDFQFYFVAIALLILSTRYLKLSIVSAFLLLVSSWIVTIYVSLQFKYIHKVSDPFESFDILYDKPYQRFGPYAMGMITGYILYRHRDAPKIPHIKAINLCLWGLSVFTLFIVIFGVSEGKLNLAMTSFYVSFGHTAWGFALMWITLSCCWGLAKPINSLLSYNGFYPLSRLTYCTYLIHPTIMMITSFQCESPLHLAHGIVMTAFLGNAVVSFLAALVMSLMFEAPIIRLLKLCFRK